MSTAVAGVATPERDPRYAPAKLEVEVDADGALVLRNPTPVVGAFATASGPLDRWAAADPARVWLVERSGERRRKLTYGEASARIVALAHGLASLGLGPGRPLLILARNGIETALATYAAMRIGAPAAPVSPQYGLPGADPSRLAHAVALIRPAAVFVDDAAVFAHALESLDAALPRIAAAGAVGRWIELDALQRGPAAPDAGRGDLIAKVLLTSGSTGLPKAVALTHANLAVNAAQIAACFDDPEPPVTVNSAPWSHSLGAHAILHMVAHRGGTLHIDGGQPAPGRFGETLRALEQVPSTYLNMVPAGWALLADALERDDALAATVFSGLRVMQYGGAGLPQSVLDRVQAAGVRATGERITFASGYGITETTPTVTNVHWFNGRAGLLGLPVPGAAARLAPVDGRLELRLRGPQIAPGYLQADATLRPLDLDEDGWLRTGDAVRLADPDGDPRRGGLVFDGRLSENFKLATGTFVGAGPLRLQALSAIGPVARDVVVCGEGRDAVGLLVFLNADACARLPGGDEGDPPHLSPAVREAVRAGLARLNFGSRGAGGRITRAGLLDHAPDLASGEMTDKGYLNQALARRRRSPLIDALFADDPGPEVIDLGRDDGGRP